MLSWKKKLLKIRAVAFDIDGVMTDGGILALSNGDLLRIFDAKDSFGVRMAKMNGLHTAVITGGSSESILKRFSVCGVDPDDIYLHSRIKLDDFKAFCQKHSLRAEEVMFIGDDLPDIPVIKACGFGVCPDDAADEVQLAADYVSDFKGGHGCVRHAVEMVLKAQGKWHLDDEKYKKMF